MQGYIKDYRQELNSDIWLMPPLYHRVWQFLKYMANHADGTIPMRDGTRLHIKRGQHLTSVRKIAQGIGWYEKGLWEVPNPKTIDVILEWLVKNDMIEIDNGKDGRQYTLVTIVNWDIYQSSEDGEPNKKPDRPPTDGTGKKGTKKVYDPDSTYMKMASYLAKKIQAWKPNAKIPKDLNGWADVFRLLVETDKRARDEIRRVIDFSTTETFWRTVILSPSSLRKNFDTLDAKSLTTAPSTNTKTPQHEEPERDPIIEKIEKLKREAGDAYDL